MRKKRHRLEWHFYDEPGLDEEAWAQIKQTASTSRTGRKVVGVGGRIQLILSLTLLMLLVSWMPPQDAERYPSPEPSVINIPATAAPKGTTGCSRARLETAALLPPCADEMDPIEQHRSQRLPRCRGELDPIEQHQSQRPPTYRLPPCGNF